MSVSGSISRQIDLCSIRWVRNIPEQGPTDTLTPGWHIQVTLPFFDLTFDSNGSNVSWRERFLRKPSMWADHKGVDVYYAGYGFGIAADNGNTGELGQSGDSTVLG